MAVRLKLWLWLSIVWMIVSVIIHVRAQEFPGYVFILGFLCGVLFLSELFENWLMKHFRGTTAVRFMGSGLSLAIAGYSFYALHLPAIPHLSVVAGAALFVFGGMNLLRSLDI